MTKNSFTITLILILPFLSIGQGDKIEWTDFERMTTSEKTPLMESVRHFFPYLTEQADWLEENAKYFHFIDLDKDGDKDLIFDGWSGGEPSCVRIYLNELNKYRVVFDEEQFITKLQISSSGLTEISIDDPGCCASYILFHTDFRVNTKKDSMAFDLTNRTATIENTAKPEEWWTNQKRFTVPNAKYFLRLTPKIDTADVWIEGRPINDNIIAEFEKGTTGSALGQAIDDTGRIWWFVEIDSGFKPKNTVFYDIEDRPTKLRGWMSSRFLTDL